MIAVGTGSFSCVFLCSRTGRYAQQCAVKHFDLETLHKAVEQGEIDSKQLELSLNRTRRITKGVSFLHQMGSVHRDIV